MAGNTALGQTFDANQVEPNTGPPPPLPTDWYNVQITDGEMKATKANDGAYAEITLKVLDGPNAGRMAWDRLNLHNQNPVAVEIAQKTLSAICHATGVFQVSDLQQLFGKQLMARIVERGPQNGYDASNEVKGYAKLGEKESKNAQNIKLTPEHGGAPATPAQPGQPAANGGAAPNFNPPWGQPQGQPAQGQNPNPPAPQNPPAQNPTPAPQQPNQAPANPTPAQPTPAPNPAQPANPPANPEQAPQAPTQPAQPTPTTGDNSGAVTPPWASQ